MALKPGDHAVADLTPEMEKLFPVTGTVTGYGESRGVDFRVETASGEEFIRWPDSRPPNGRISNDVARRNLPGHGNGVYAPGPS